MRIEQQCHTRGADALIIGADWKEFRSSDFDGMKAELRRPVTFDRRIWFEAGLAHEMGLNTRPSRVVDHAKSRRRLSRLDSRQEGPLTR
ncbi:MAG TPA: hypothetical protein VFU71_10990 [Burkholderiaceae bacterium]|nr:hypothetical protein [Burkholderiaceae bacterium]